MINADLTGGIKTLINSAEKLLTVLFVPAVVSILLHTEIITESTVHISVIYRTDSEGNDDYTKGV